jgi:hypothetical protein
MSDTSLPRAPRRTPCHVRVIVREEADPDTIIHDRRGDHNDSYFRDWIISTTYWAMRNGKAVSMYPDPD